MSGNVIGLDFGSHHGSIALLNLDKDRIEVIADDLGSRTIPTCVGYRGEEVLIGQAALSQQYKNSSNTFDDVRSYFIGNKDGDKEGGGGGGAMMNVPALSKDIPITDLPQHFFRNIHNQVKQQVGTAVRDCVLTLPSFISNTLTDDDKKRLISLAQGGGIRIKSIIDDSMAVLLAYGMDSPSFFGTVCVVDMGWSKTEVSLYDVKAGVISKKSESLASSVKINTLSGSVIVDLLAKHCAKDFSRRTRLNCADSSKSMMRIKKECEAALKILSTGTEANIDIDSLYEGADYSSKISRARFDDLCAIAYMMFKKETEDFLASSGISCENITHLCLAGGIASVPRSQAILKEMFPNATVPRPGKSAGTQAMSTSAEAQCVGAALHAKMLVEQGVLEDAMTVKSTEMQALSATVFLTSSATTGDAFPVLPVGTPLPCSRSIDASITNVDSHFSLVLEDKKALADIVISVPGASADTPQKCTIEVSATEAGAISVEVKSSSGESLASVEVPSSA